MAGELVLQPGEHRQLRAHGEAQRWESDNPRVATVTDEDLVAGTHGGLVTAVRAGQARITAVDFDGRNAIELAVTVAGAAPLALAAGARAVLPGDPAAGWTTEQTQVVRLEPGGQVVGLGPGVARVRDAAGSAEHEVRVSGALELGVGQRLALAERFGVAVNSWRAGSPAAEIDSHGVLTAGDRARALDVSATLASGEVFTFEVRIRAAAAAPEPVATTEVRVPPVTLPPDPPRSEPRAAAAEEVARHLAQARACAEQGQWEPSGGHLTAATVAAAGNPELEARVQATRAELRQASAGPGVTELLDALLAHDFAGARERARAARVPPGQREGLAAAADLIAPVERLTQGSLSPGDDLQGLQRHWVRTWQAAAEQPAARCALARLAAEWGLEDAAPSLVAAYARPAGPGSLEEVRAAVVEAVQALGGAGVAAAAAELAACEPGDPAGAWVLDLLVSLEPKRHGGTLTRLFERLGPSHQAGLSDWLATLLTRSPNALFDLLAGTLSRAPVDPRLARRVQAACGAERLERQATKLAANGHGGARVVLRNLYGY